MLKNKLTIENPIPKPPVFNKEMEKMVKSGATLDEMKKEIEQIATKSADELADKKTDLWAWDTEFQLVYDALFNKYCV